jgi:hypothetical protein
VVQRQVPRTSVPERRISSAGRRPARSPNVSRAWTLEWRRIADYERLEAAARVASEPRRLSGSGCPYDDVGLLEPGNRWIRRVPWRKVSVGSPEVAGRPGRLSSGRRPGCSGASGGRFARGVVALTGISRLLRAVASSGWPRRAAGTVGGGVISIRAWSFRYHAEEGAALTSGRHWRRTDPKICVTAALISG